LPSSESEAWKYVQERFGIGREDLDFSFRERSGDIWVTTGEEEQEAQTEGFRFLRDTKHGFKPTTYALQFLGDRISKNIVEVDAEEIQVLLEGDMIQRKMDEKGYVAIKFQDQIFGCGLYKDQLVSSRIPKGRGKELLRAIQY
jgi:NOL1/NOP2/fmu family ribosome biogenesis protein